MHLFLVSDKRKEAQRAMARKKYSESEKLKKEKIWTIRRIIVIALAAAAVIAALSVAWFVSNTRVQFTGMSVSADMKSVELRTYGAAGIHDDLLKKITGVDKTTEPKSFWYELEDKVNGFFQTSPDKYAINWLLSDTSNIGNYSAEQSDWETYWKNPPQGVERQDKAIEPGSSGELTFYVVPNYDGVVDLNMNLSLIPYKVEGDNFTEITKENDNVARDFIDGHILFFLENGTETGQTETDQTEKSQAGKNQKEIQWIKDGTFNIKIADAKKNQEYGYTLYWSWAQSFAEAVLAANDSYLNERKPLFSEFKNGETIRNTILQTDVLSMVNKPERYFYSNLTKGPLTSKQKELSEISNMYNQSSESLSEDAKNAFIDLSSYYNQADQYIGGHVDCVRIRLSYE